MMIGQEGGRQDSVRGLAFTRRVCYTLVSGTLKGDATSNIITNKARKGQKGSNKAMNNKTIELLNSKVAEAKRAKREAKLAYKRAKKALKLAKDNLRHAKALQKSEQLLEARRGLVDDMLANKTAKPARKIKVEEK